MSLLPFEDIHTPALAGAKVGDRIVLCGGYKLEPYKIVTVAKVLKQYLLDETGKRWRFDGTPSGERGYTRNRAYAWTVDLQMEFESISMRNDIRRWMQAHLDKAPHATLSMILELIGDDQ